MATHHHIGHEWLRTRESSLLLTRTEQVSIFPHPNAFYALYRTIIHKEPLNKKVEYPFVPFHVPHSGSELFGECGERKKPEDYGDWISTLVGFLNSPLIVEYNSDSVQTVQLTHFGNFIFPHLMRALADLYRQNDSLRKVVAEYHSSAPDDK